MNNPSQQLSPDFDQVPTYLKEAPRWLLWRRHPQPEGKKPRKVPYYVNGKRRTELDTPRDHAQLVSFDEAWSALQRAAGVYAGLGFALGADGAGGYWQGIDLDKLSAHPELHTTVDRLPGYVEYSPSGDGVHAIGYGRRFINLGSDGSGTEAYCKGRFFTFTGNVIKAGPRVDLAAEALKLLKLRDKHEEHSRASTSNDLAWASAREIDPVLERDLRSALAHLNHNDYDEWLAVAHALKGGGEKGHEIWLEWSMRSDLFDAEIAHTKWESIRSPQIGPEAIFARAERNCWINPRKVHLDRTSWKASANDERYRREFTFVSAGELLANLAPPRYLVQDYIEHGSLNLLFGEPGAGKSFLALDWSSCIATGTQWHGRSVLNGPVFYIAGEGHSGLGRRLKAWELHHDQPLSDAPLYVSKAAAALMDEASAQNVHAAVAGLVEKLGSPTLVVIDTMHRNLGSGDENSAEDVAAFLHHIDEYIRKPFDCAVLIVHHSGHADKSRARGSSSIQGAMDSMFGLHNKNGLQCLTCPKQKDGEPPRDLYFVKKVIDLSFAMGQDSGQSSLVLVPATPEEMKGLQRVVQERALVLLEALLNEQPLEPPQSVQESHPHVRVVATMEAWRQRYCDVEADGSIKIESIQRRFSRECKQLYEQGVVMKSGDHVWITD